MRKILVILAMLALVSIGYGIGQSRMQIVAHAAETPRWVKTEIPLSIGHDLPGYAIAQGFWQSTSSSKDKQLVFPVAVKMICTLSDKTCREAQASVTLGVLGVDIIEYDVSSWTKDGIAADATDEGDCSIGHRLSIDFKSNSVIVSDYPKKVTNNKLCQAFQEAGSYALHGGQLQLYPPVAFDALAK